MVESGELLEWAEVFGHCYGTPRRPVEKALQAGRDVLFDIDWQGTQQLSEKARDDLVSVFILPPTVEGIASIGWSGARRTATTSSARAWPKPPAR